MLENKKTLKKILLVGLYIFIGISLTSWVILYALVNYNRFHEMTAQKLMTLMNEDKDFLTKTCSAVCNNHEGWLGEFAYRDNSVFCSCKDATQEITIEPLLPLLTGDRDFLNKACNAVCPGHWWIEDWKSNSHQFLCDCAD